MDNYNVIMDEILQKEEEYQEAKKYADEIYAQAKTVEDELKNAKKRMVDAMLSDGVLVQSLKGFRVSLRKKPAMLDFNPKAVPDEFMRKTVKVEPDKKAISDFVKKNPCNWARMEETGEHILQMKIEG